MTQDTQMTGGGFEFGWDAPPMKEQHPALSDFDAEHFDKDNQAIIRLSIRGLLTDAEKRAAFKRLATKIEKDIRRSVKGSGDGE